LKGRYYWNRRTAENIKKAIEQFKSATDRDPNYALAYVGLGDCYAVLGEYATLVSLSTMQAEQNCANAANTAPALVNDVVHAIAVGPGKYLCCRPRERPPPVV
jgi:tetratricopeptide (TPR) repeat protein